MNGRCIPLQTNCQNVLDTHYHSTHRTIRQAHVVHGCVMSTGCRCGSTYILLYEGRNNMRVLHDHKDLSSRHPVV
jgi:hypothetical protein